ncbi:voltage-dependent anion-selective channel protein 2-like [Scleropages formosus]|uniref:voltage-dependent anion-selective channel protein 2-like n=1 Tax=Scleropages formosus TaxID=113540 RepID=UPI0008785EB1|nr:voltage-dependent anion-selective channel protein 2-like [Scleropages formosus]
MTVPPSYSDLGKSAKEIFSKGCGFGVLRLDVKTKPLIGLELKGSASCHPDTSTGDMIVEMKCKWSSYEVAFTEKLNADKTIGAEITVKDNIAKGLKIAFDTAFSLSTGMKRGKVKTAYECDCINIRCDVDLGFHVTAVHGAAVVGYNGWLAGCQMTFDTAKSKVAQTNFAVGYESGDFQLHANVKNGSEFGGSIYQKVADNLETAVSLLWTAGSISTRFGVAAKYQLDSNTSINAKVNNEGLVGLDYSQTLQPGVKLNFSALIDGKSISGGHRLGLGLELGA